MSITAFEERKYLKWGDFLDNFNQKYTSKDFKKEEKNYLCKLIDVGNEYQEQLNEGWLDYGYMTFKQYASQMNKYIALQDMIINDIAKFVTRLEKYNTTLKGNKNVR